jgi:uncharacterized membrane protein
MTDSVVYVPVLMGLAFLVAGIFSYRRDLIDGRGFSGLAILGPTFVAASLAAFAGEHFTAAKGLATLVPKWMPAKLFITYFVGVAHACAALSLVARRYVRWAGAGMAMMFALFVFTLYLPSLVRHADVRMAWIFPFREGTFAMGGLALLAAAMSQEWPRGSRVLVIMATMFAGIAVMFFGTQNLLYPQFSPGVPDATPTAAWVPFPHGAAYAIGVLMVAFGAGMLVRRFAPAAGALAGAVMVALTLALYVPNLLLARGVPEQVNAFNFIFDTLLFGGTLLVIAGADANVRRQALHDASKR